MSKSSREQEIFYLGANATSKAYQGGLEDFNDLIIRLEEMKNFGFIEKYSFKDHFLWITTSEVIASKQWNLGLEEINGLLDGITPQKKKLTNMNVRCLNKGDCVLFPDGSKAKFIRWSWIDDDYAVLSGSANNRLHARFLVGAIRIPKHLEAINEQGND